MDGSTTTGEQFLTLGEACRVVGVTRPTLRQRIRNGELACFDDWRDRRRRLVSARDLATLNTPRLRPRLSAA